MTDKTEVSKPIYQYNNLFDYYKKYPTVIKFCDENFGRVNYTIIDDCLLFKIAIDGHLFLELLQITLKESKNKLGISWASGPWFRKGWRLMLDLKPYVKEPHTNV